MSSRSPLSTFAGNPLGGELRYGLEFARLLADPVFRSPRRPHASDPGGGANEPRPVLLIPGFMAGDASMTVLAGWLRRRGHTVHGSGMRVNTGCAGRDLARLDALLATLEAPVILIGQSRGGTMARALAARSPRAVEAMVTLGSPVLDPLAVSPTVLNTVRAMARLGDLGLPGVFSSKCRDGECCSDFRSLLTSPLPPTMLTLAVYSRSDGIVDWHACLDPAARCVEIDGSHCGMAVNADVYRELETVLQRVQEAPCSR